MNQNFVKMVVLSAYRRRKSMWKVVLLSFLCVFLFGGIMIFQDVMNRFQRENAMKEGGNWFVAAERESELIREHAYVDREGSMVVRTTEKKAGAIGTADENFFGQSNIRIYEGRLPETENEVAVTRQALSELGERLEVGQRITLNYNTKIPKDGKPQYDVKEVTVTGILASYTKSWVNDIVFPEFFLTKEGLKSLKVKDEGKSYYFYSLRPEQIDVDGGKFYEKLQGMLSEQGEYNTLVYNRVSYDVTMWGNQNMYDMAIALCALLGSMSLIYLFTGCLHDRRSIYFRYLELGMTKGQLRGMIGIEWTAVFLPAACAALICSMAFTGIGAKILSAKYEIPDIFYLSGRSLFLILLFTFGVFFLVFLWCCMGFRVKGLHEMTGQMPVRRLKHLQKKRDRRFGGVVLFQKRRGRMYPAKAVVRGLFTVVALSIVLYMSVLWRDRYLENRSAAVMADIIGGGTAFGTGNGGLMVVDDNGRLDYNQEILKDAAVSEEEREEKRCEVVQVTPIAPENYGTTISSGLTEKQKEKIQKIHGVREVKGETAACDMKLDWENSENSGFRIDQYIEYCLAGTFTLLRQNISELAEGEYNKAFAMIPNDLACYEYMLCGLEKSEAIDRELRRYDKTFDRDAFWAGETGILFVLTDDDAMSDVWNDELTKLEGVLSYDREKQMYRFQGELDKKYQYSFREDTIQSGDEIRILDSGKKELFSTKVMVSTDREYYRRLLESAAEIYAEDNYFNLCSQISQWGGYFFIGSENMMKKLADKQGKSLSYHTLNVWLEEGTDWSNAEKQVAKLFSEYGCEYQSTVEYKSKIQGALDRQRIISVTVILLVACCYFFIMQTMERKEMEQMHGQLQLLLQQGVWKRDILWVRTFFHSKGYLWGIFCIPLCGLWLGIGEWKEFSQAYEGTELGVDRAVFLKELIAGWGDRLQDVWLWGIFAILVIAVVLFTMVSEWRYLKGMKQ